MPSLIAWGLEEIAWGLEVKRAIKRRRKRVAWDPTYLAEILGTSAN